MNIPKELKYTKSHEWLRTEGNLVSVGITDYAQKEISDVVFVELPKIGQKVEAAKPVAVVESVKAAFDIYAPVSGTIRKVNSSIEDDPGLVNQDCYGQGWFFQIEASDPSQINELMNSDDYQNNLKTEAH